MSQPEFPKLDFKADRVWREDDEPTPGQGGAEGLQRIAYQAADLALAEVALTVVLVVDQHRWEWPIAGGEQEKGRDRLAIRAGVPDAHAAISRIFI